MTSTKAKLWCSTLMLLIVFESAKCLELLTLGVPGWTALGTRAELSCRWQLGSADVLYSVKWYKDGKEFFQHVPRDAEPRRSFPLPGVDVEDSNSSGSELVLTPASLATGGRYRCEVSGEGPLFPTVSHYADMNVVALPEHGPIISGLQQKYRLGDRVRPVCSSGRSQPATQLSWLINGEPLPSEEYSTSYRSKDALIVTNLTLDLEITEMHFRKRLLKIKCLATITPIYWKSNEVAAVLENTTKSQDTEIVIENQKAKRTDRSHVNFTNNSFTHSPFRRLLFIGVFVSVVGSIGRRSIVKIFSLFKI